MTTDPLLKPCPFCGGGVSFHQEEGECDGCHYIHCAGCGAMVDLSKNADHNNDCDTIAELRAVIVPFWNRRVP